MSNPTSLDLARLRRSCAQCSLQQLCLPAGISGSELARLDDIVRRRKTLRLDERLFRIGEALSAVYVAREGAVKTVSLSEHGGHQIVGFHLPGELIGLDALGAGIHHCEAIALGDTSVCEVPFAQLTQIASQIPGLHRQLLKVIGQSMGRDHDHVTMLVGRRHAHERIALFLHGLAERFRQVGMSGVAFKLPMSREDIATYLGMANETVSRAFARLVDDGVITVHGRRVDVVDRVELERLAHGSDQSPQRRAERRSR